MAVEDPNFVNFNYAAALRNAVQPLETLGTGQLALTQQRGERMFQLARDKSQSDLALQREMASERARAQFANENELARLREADRLTKAREQGIFERGKKEDQQKRFEESGFTPDPGLSPEENDREYFKTQGDKAVANHQDLVAQRNGVLAKLTQQIQARAQPTPEQQAVIESQVRRDIANDPNLVKQLQDPRIRAGLQKNPGEPGYISMEDVLNSDPHFWNSSNLSDRAAILTSANAARTLRTATLTAANDKTAAAETAGLNGRYNDLNAALVDSLATVNKYAPSRISEALNINAAQGQPVPTGSTSVNGISLQHNILGGPVAQTPVSSPAAVTAPAGTPYLEDPNYHSAVADLRTAQSKAPSLDAQIGDLQKQLHEGGANTFTPSTGGSGFSSLTPRFQKHGVEQMGEIAKQLLKLRADKDKNDLEIRTGLEKVKALNPDFGKPVAPAAFSQPPPVSPPDPTLVPSPTGLSAPPPISAPIQAPVFAGNPAPSPGPFSPVSQATPQFQPQTTNAPIAAPAQPNQGNQFQQQAFLNKIYQIVGTNDQTVLARAKAWLHDNQGLSQDQLTQTVQAAVGGDQTAQRRLKLAVISVQGQPQFGTPPPPLPQPIQ